MPVRRSNVNEALIDQQLHGVGERRAACASSGSAAQCAVRAQVLKCSRRAVLSSAAPAVCWKVSVAQREAVEVRGAKTREQREGAEERRCVVSQALPPPHGESRGRGG